MPELIPIEGDPFAGFNFRAVVGAPGAATVPAMPDAPAAQVPVSMTDNAPPVTLTPVEGNPFTQTYDPQPILAGEPPIPIPTATSIVGGFMGGLKQFLSTPGNVAQGQEPTTPGQWSDEDEALRQANERGENLWGPQTALMMVGGGGPVAERGALGAAGGRVVQPATDAAATAPRFYSALENAVGNATTKAAPAEQWLGAIRNTPGVKPEELQWTGLEDWLKSQKGNVSKDQVADFIRGNKVDVQEVMRGGADLQEYQRLKAIAQQAYDDYHAARDAHDNAYSASVGNEGKQRLRQAQEDAFARWEADEMAMTAKSAQLGNEPKFRSYTVPGGENYRELLLTMPPSPAPAAIIRAAARELALAQGIDVNRLSEAGWRQMDQEVLKQGLASGPSFTGSHWDEPNVLAHIRFDDRKIGNDNALHMAEIQSDWHQKGRKGGYQTQLKPSGRSVEDIDRDMDANIAELTRREGDQDVSDAEAYRQWARNPDLLARHHALAQERSAARGVTSNVLGAVPDAPFKTTWPELSLKRMIRYAAENGYDRLSWDTGATNADRYDLSKQISGVEFTRHGSSGFSRHEDIDNPAAGGILKAYDLNGRKIMDQYVESPEKLVDHIGKEAAEKLLAQEGSYGVVSGTAQVRRRLNGLDLKVGGEGMAGFYDRMLPAAANKLGKKYGARVEQSEIDAAARDQNGMMPKAMDPAARKPAWSLKITPALRKAALEQGFPLFAIGGIAAGAAHQLVPVDHDPFARQLVPVDHNPFQ